MRHSLALLCHLAAGGGFSPVVSTFSVVVLVALSGLVLTFSSTVVVVVPPGAVTVVSDVLPVVVVGSQPVVATHTMQAIARGTRNFIADFLLENELIYAAEQSAFNSKMPPRTKIFPTI